MQAISGGFLVEKIVGFDNQMLETILSIQGQMAQVNETMSPLAQEANSAFARASLSADMVSNTYSRAVGNLHQVAQPINEILRVLNFKINFVTDPLVKMHADGCRKKAELKERYILNRDIKDETLRDRGWHILFPALKPLEKMTEDEFDTSIEVIGPFVWPRVDISHLECFAAEHGICRDEIRALTPWEVSRFLDELENKFIRWNAYKAQREAKCFSIEKTAVRPGKVSRNQELISRLATVAFDFLGEGCTYFIAAGKAIDKLRITFMHVEIGGVKETNSAAKNVFYTSADNPRKSAQTVIEREMKKLDK